MKKILLFAGTLWCLGLVFSQTTPILRMAEDTQLWLQSLPAEKAQAAMFSFEDEERFNWHFIPRERKGVALREMTGAQRKLAENLLASGLGEDGHRKVNQIMYLDQILHEMENFSPRRDADGYYFSIFGRPSPTGSWGWRFEGHHLSLNFTLGQGRVISAFPLFFGANPAEVRQGPHQGLRVLAAEEDGGRKLVSTFTGAMRNKVVIDVVAPDDIITGASRKADLGAPTGVSVREMTPEQKQLLEELLKIYAGRVAPSIRDDQLQRIRNAGFEQVHFAWAGDLQQGKPHYYRIHGPTFLIEYDNTQNNANHIHTVWRDLENDFGEDPLRTHYESGDHHQAVHVHADGVVHRH